MNNVEQQSSEESRWLIDLDFPSLMRSRSLNLPPIPDNWKPGLFSDITAGDKPWGTTKDAIRLLQGNKIEQGRELLRRLCKHTLEPTAKAVFAYELRRPPEDNVKSWSYLSQISESSCEYLSIKAIGVLASRDYDIGGELFFKATQTRPSSVHGCAYFVHAFLYVSDLYLQTRLLVPRNQGITRIIITPPLKGAVQLSLRQYEAAWKTFFWGWVQEKEHSLDYTDTLKVNLTDEETKFLRMTMSDMCVLGMGLELWDIGLYSEATKIFSVFAETITDNMNIQYAVQELAQKGE